MELADFLGRFGNLTVKRLGPPGAFLGLRPEDPEDVAEVVLLPNREVPEGCKPGDPFEAFLYLDSEDRLVATLCEPLLVLGEVRFLRVTDVAPFGAFVDWGPAKELLVPLAEQTVDLRVGDLQPVGLYIDDTGRLAGTMRVSEMLQRKGNFEKGEWVTGEAWRNESELGLFVIVEASHLGLLPAAEPHALTRGQSSRFRVTHIHPDGKFELSLRAPAHLELDNDARAIFEKLSGPRPPQVSDATTPEEIRVLFGISKKAFKRAVGRLLRDGKLALSEQGTFAVVSPK